jgi:short-subunit dehydrogenase
LSALENHIQAACKVKCHSLAVDLSEHYSSTAVYDWVRENNYRVNILINNVGIGSKGAFEKGSIDFYYKQINLNVVTACMLTRLFIDELKANSPSHILNVGSMGGFFFLPDKTLYSATKAFIYSFSRSLRIELKPSGINVSVLCPGGTDSNENTIAINKDVKGLAKISILQSEAVAKEGIGKMLKNRPLIIPGKMNKFYYHLGKIVPDPVKNFFIGRAFKKLKEHKY